MAPGSARSAAEAPPADLLGRFRLERLLGRGGMGQVWLALDPVLSRRVAVKTVPFVDLDGRPDWRFEREMRALAALNHPSIAQIYEVGTAPWPRPDDPPVHYLVLEYVEGVTLADTLAKGPIAVADAIRLILLLLDGLAVAHGRLLVHRDIKPANIMLTPDGGVKLLDLGLALTRLLPERIANPAVSPDGRRLAVVVNHGSLEISLRLYELLPGPAVGRPVWQRDGLRSQWAGMRPRFSPDGRWLAYEDARPEGAGADLFAVRVVDPGGAPPVRLTALSEPVSLTSWFDWVDGRRIVLSAGRQRVQLELVRDADYWIRKARSR